jgi:hypothetical protein
MEKKFIRNPNFIFRKIVDETILVPIRQNVAELNCIYSLNEVGSFLWQKLAEPQDLSTLQSAVLIEFDASAEQVAADISHFLTELSNFGALEEA